jgi:uncharacterized protein
VKTHYRLDGIHILTIDPEVRRSAGHVIFSHGFTVPGFESHRMFLDAAERLASIGIASSLFDYRGSGYSDWSFEQMTLHTELDDIGAVLNFTRSRETGPLIVWGMSLGTCLAAKIARERPDLVSGLVSWCSSFDTYERWEERYRDLLAAGGGATFLPSGFKVTTELLESVQDFDLVTDLQNTVCPLLMVHGTEDDSTDIRRATRGMDSLNRPFERVIIEGGNHGFKNQPAKYEEALSVTLSWIEREAAH